MTPKYVPTPGPWKAVPRASDAEPFHEEEFLGWEIEGPPESYRGQFARGADAYLVSAAPDLYQALLKMCVAHEMGDLLPEDAFINAYNEAQSAILKARGGIPRTGGEYTDGTR